jgi:hypothetical protein
MAIPVSVLALQKAPDFSTRKSWQIDGSVLQRPGAWSGARAVGVMTMLHRWLSWQPSVAVLRAFWREFVNLGASVVLDLQR